MSKLLSPRADARPLPDLGERSAFVGGQRIGRARRRRARSVARVARVARTTLWAGTVAALLGFPAHWGLTSPRFAVARVDVRGASRVPVDRIREAAGVPTGINIFRLRPPDVVARVEALPEIRRAEVVRELPGRVSIVVEERQPFTLAYVGSGGPEMAPTPPTLGSATGNPGRSSIPRRGRLFWVDEDGRVIAEERRAVVPPAPIVSGLDEEEIARGHADAGPRMRAAIALIRTLLRSQSALSDEVSEVDVSQPDGPVLRTVSGIEVRLGGKATGADEWGDRLARLEGVLAQVASQDPGVSVVDLRFKDQVVLRRGGQPSDARRPKS